MSKKRDPIITVMAFFEHADLALAESALELARDKVRARRPSTKLAPAKKKVNAAKPATAAGATEH